MIKRAFDVCAAALGLLLLSPLLAVVAILVKLDSEGPMFFSQERVGRGFCPFRIHKFRTMVHNEGTVGQLITCGQDPRITRIGAVLRRFKIDELPQLVNVLKGEMSLVGPRPEVPRYVELFHHDYEEVLQVRPGISDLASIHYRDESALLAQCDNPEREYVERILPHKIGLAKVYVRESGFLYDLQLIAMTFLALVPRSSSSRPKKASARDTSAIH